MTEYVFKLPDLGEGTVEAEIVEWHVKPGDEVKEGDIIVDVMTEKANVEVPAPEDGKVLRTSGEPGEIVAVGSELIALETKAKAPRRRRGAEAEPEPEPEAAGKTADVETDDTSERAESPSAEEPEGAAETADRASAEQASADEASDDATSGDEEPARQTPSRSERVITSPAIRRRAKEAGIDLYEVSGSGPRGRILRRDLEAALEGGSGTRQARRVDGDTGSATDRDDIEEIKVIGVRRVIAERMSQSKREIPHFAYVEEIDVTELEALRRHLNQSHERRLTVLPFIAAGLIRALADFPQCNARFDSERGVIQRFKAIHLGIATQTPDGLKVPVVHDAHGFDLWRLADEITRVAEAARDGKASRGELSGSTITITSLGRMGGIVTTPVINYPEVGIIGVNKAVERPVVLDGQIRVRTMMNLSSSFDHRFVDGFDAAAMIQQVKSLLEHPATLFLPSP
ncbi:MAG: dihydrolipoamide acetyltransferase family protein [Gammaproteobacteria bacterium]|nr:dihydrolipoamide acetyltransferase family protein [Gammaproteobacteria bacterium]